MHSDLGRGRSSCLVFTKRAVSNRHAVTLHRIALKSTIQERQECRAECMQSLIFNALQEAQFMGNRINSLTKRILGLHRSRSTYPGITDESSEAKKVAPRASQSANLRYRLWR
jgi:hypothetical protein